MSPGFIYVMECQGFYKIGWSSVPRKRRSCIQTDNPHPVTLVGVIEGNKSDEADWHYLFRDKRVQGEWFELTEREVEHVLHESFGIDYVD